ncbi:MAG TPA: hypothetical protein ENF73_06070 [Proteobacteria bacterium]|nr:hypothetical protein [Pseudomonadota bacterium]
MLGERTLRAALPVPLFVIHCPAAYIALFKVRWYAGALVILLLWGFLILWTSLKGRRRRLPFFVLCGVYTAAILAATGVPAYFAFLIGGWLKLAIALATAAALFAAGASRRARVPLVIVALAVACFLTSDIHPSVRLRLLVILAAALFIGAFVRAGAVALALAGLGSSVFAVILNFWIGVPIGDLDSVRAQSGVEPIIDYSGVGDDPLLSQLPYFSDIKFVAESCEPDVYLVGVRRRVSGLLRLNAGNPSDRRFFETPSEIGDNAVVDCESKTIYFGLRSGVLYALDEKTLDVKDKVDLGKPQLGAVYPGSRRLYVLFDQSGAWAAVDRANLRNVRWLAARGFNNGLLISRDNRRLYHLSNKGVVSIWSAETLTLKRSATVSRGALAFLNMALDDGHGRLYVMSMESGRIEVLDADSLDVVGSGEIARGIRFSIYNPANGMLYVANYFSGELYEVAPKGLAVSRRWYLGPRLRWLELAGDGEAALIASSLGAFRVELRDAEDR